MSIVIELSHDLERALRERAASEGQDLAALIERIVVEDMQVYEPPRYRRPPSAEEFGAWLDAWTKLRPVLDHAIDDSRE